MSNEQDHELAEAELALAILEREEEAHPIDHSLRWSYGLLQPVVVLYALTLLALIVIWLADLEPFGDQNTTMGALATANLGLALVAMVLFFVCLKFVWHFRTREKLLGQLRLQSVLDLGRNTDFHRNSLGDYVSLGLVVFGASVILGSLAVYAVAVVMLFDSAVRDMNFIGFLGILASFILVLGIVLIGQNFVRRAKLRQQRGLTVRALKQHIEQRKEKAHAEGTDFQLSRAMWRKLATYEREQVDSRRDAAIRSSAKSGPRGYSVLKSRDVLDEQRNLDQETIRELNQAVKELTESAEQLSEAAETQRRSLDIPKSQFKLSYEIDNARRQITLFELSSTAQDAGARDRSS